MAIPEFTMRVKCSQGTYVRTLAQDMGDTLGCGAHLAALRRLAVGRCGWKRPCSLRPWLN